MNRIDYKKMQKVIDCARDFGVKGTLEEKGLAFDYLVNYLNGEMKRHDAKAVIYKSLFGSAESRNKEQNLFNMFKNESVRVDCADNTLNFMLEALALIHAGYKPTGNRMAINEMKKELNKMNRHEKSQYYGVVRFEESAFLPCGRKTEGCTECDACR